METFTIPVMRPRLPDADAILPYLRRIDVARIYSNMGPLASELSIRLQERFGIPAVPVANATVGLTIALLAHRLPRGGLCLVPAWTFAASAQAILAAGLVPFLTDVDPVSGQLTPDIAIDALEHAPGAVVAAMPVAPFGAALEMSGWEDLAARTGLTVLVDAAAGFDSATATALPQVISLHATKILGAGEGGFVLCPDRDIQNRVTAASNFGFAGSRVSAMPALNAKMSEYHAAIALAALDLWPQTRAAHQEVLTRLRHALPSLSWPEGLGEAFVTNTLVAEFAAGAETAAVHFARRNIDTRRWWGEGLHHHPAFAQCPRRPLPETDRRAASTLGLPCHLDLGPHELGRLARAMEGL